MDIMQNDLWYYSLDGRYAEGPVSRAELKIWIQRGVLTRDSWVRPADRAAWQKATTVKRLFHTILCPECGKKNYYAPELVGHSVKCGHCHRPFLMPLSPDADLADHCPRCKSYFFVSDGCACTRDKLRLAVRGLATPLEEHEYSDDELLEWLISLPDELRSEICEQAEASTRTADQLRNYLCQQYDLYLQAIEEHHLEQAAAAWDQFTDKLSFMTFVLTGFDSNVLHERWAYRTMRNTDNIVRRLGG